MQKIRHFFIFYLILYPLYVVLSPPSLSTKLVTQHSLNLPIYYGFITGSYYVITMRLVCDNYVIHLPCLSYCTEMSLRYRFGKPSNNGV